MPLAPIALFVYNRPSHTRLTIEALRNNELARESDLIVYSDASKSIKDRDNVEKVRSYIRGIAGFKSITLIERDKNYGLAESIITGVAETVGKFGTIIVLEDDMVTSPYFLRYMNDALTVYCDTDKVSSIHGYAFPAKAVLPETFFRKGADCWGWATWKRAWELFEPDGSKLLKELKCRRVTRDFDLDGAFALTKMLEDQINGKNNSWAIRWQASTYLADSLTLNSRMSLVRNIGFDGSGVHCGTMSSPEIVLADRPVNIVPIPIEECKLAREDLVAYYRHRKNIFVRIRGRALRLFGKR